MSMSTKLSDPVLVSYADSEDFFPETESNLPNEDTFIEVTKSFFLKEQDSAFTTPSETRPLTLRSVTTNSAEPTLEGGRIENAIKAPLSDIATPSRSPSSGLMETLSLHNGTPDSLPKQSASSSSPLCAAKIMQTGASEETPSSDSGTPDSLCKQRASSSRSLSLTESSFISASESGDISPHLSELDSSYDDILLLKKFLEKSFNETSWVIYFGDIGTPPPLPSDLSEIIENFCPFFDDKSVEETHKLVLIPKTINGKQLTLNHFEDLLSRPKHWTPSSAYINTDPIIKDSCGNQSIHESYWLLITYENIPQSESLTPAAQRRLVTSCPSYVMPSRLELAIFNFIESVSPSKPAPEIKFNPLPGTIFFKNFPQMRSQQSIKARPSLPGTRAARPFCALENRETS